MNLSSGSLFVSRYAAALSVIVLSMFGMAAVFGIRASTGPTAENVGIFAVELVLAIAGAVLTYRFIKGPARFKASVVVLLFVLVIFHGWLLFVHVDTAACPWGATSCDISYGVYLAMLLVLAFVLLLAKEDRHGVAQ
jgi:hypothetical protein